MTAAPDARRFDAIVLGAGITGLVAAAVLIDQGADRVLVVDQYPTAGGNHLDRSIGAFTFDVGSFIFQDDSPLLRWFPELLDEYVPIQPSWSRLNPQGKVTDYPFSIRDDLIAAGPWRLARIVFSLITTRIRNRPVTDARSYAEHWLGREFVRRSGLANYMERFCGLSIDRIDLQFAESRMGWIPGRARLGPYLRDGIARVRGRRSPARADSSNTQLARPRAGFAALYRPVVESLTARGVTFAMGQSPLAVRRSEDEFVVQTADRVAVGKRVISTIPVDHALALIDASAESLPTVTLLSLFYSFRGERGFESAILYNFADEARWKRLTMYSDFYGASGGREYFTAEVVCHGPSVAAAEADSEFRAHTIAHGLFAGDLRLEGHHVLEHAYPIFTAGSGARAAEAIARIGEFGIESFGRQGGFQYQPTARDSTQAAETALGADHQEVRPMWGSRGPIRRD